MKKGVRATKVSNMKDFFKILRKLTEGKKENFENEIRSKKR